MAERSHRLPAVVLRGFAIGLADLVPGVSGGTVAFITGIYARLINALHIASSPSALLLLLRGNLRSYWIAADASFLACLGAGALSAALLGAETLRWLLIHRTVALLSFFCGLTLAAAVLIALRIERKDLTTTTAGLIGIAAAAAFVLLDPVSLQNAPPASGFFLAGMLAFPALILPGISGSFLLLLIGVYPFLLEAVHNREIGTLAAFVAGGAIGVLTLIKFLRILLAKYHDITVATLVGVMLGALPKLWPWKVPADEGVKIILQAPQFPWQAASPEYLAALLAFLAGIILVALTETLAKKLA
ncbi:MAG: DUF368 domain-containing protein [Betaproteobacteria bacterium]|nr:DUF368 domain-containing protein [Betaproteobacteria bacterium]